MKNKPLEQWEAEVARVKQENNALQERSNQAQETRFDAVANAAAGLSDPDVKEALLGELEQLRQNLTSEMELRQQYADELANLQGSREAPQPLGLEESMGAAASGNFTSPSRIRKSSRDMGSQLDYGDQS